MKTKAELLAAPLDCASIVYDDDREKSCSREAWAALIVALDSGHVVRIHQSVYQYFLEVLPPLKMFSGGFVFCEGCDSPTYFINLGKEGYVAYKDYTKEVDSSAYVYEDWHGPAALKPTL